MTGPATQFPTHESLLRASRLLLQGDDRRHAAPERQPDWTPAGMLRDEFDDFVKFGHLHHVIVRSLEVFLTLSRQQPQVAQVEWAAQALAAEKARIETAIHFLHQVCVAFQESGFDVIVIKSLDHWPDLGSDLDLYTDAGTDDVSELMKDRFAARIAPRSWGDRLAQKWNFHLPGLPEPVEVHIGRLGQTGEQNAIATGLLRRARPAMAGGYAFRVPSMADRIMISTLQRMYRHFNFRLSDIVNTAAAADAGAIDFENLRSLAKAAGTWEGVATYLVIVSDFVRNFRGFGLVLPPFVTAAARFGGRELYYTRGYLRIPVMPHSARLYGSQLAGTLGRGEFVNGARLSLLPWLATAAAVKEKLTGSDKGIW
jgi:hypothetical protein